MFRKRSFCLPIEKIREQSTINNNMVNDEGGKAVFFDFVGGYLLRHRPAAL